MEIAGGVDGTDAGARGIAVKAAATPCGNPCEGCARAPTCPALAILSQMREGGCA